MALPSPLQFADKVKQENLRAQLSTWAIPMHSSKAWAKTPFSFAPRSLTRRRRTGSLKAPSSPCRPTGVDVLSFDLVSPVVARETVTAALWAVLAASVGYSLYIWWAFRSVPSPFRYGVAAIIALIHDTAIVIGIFAILGEVADMEVNTMFLIALLTVIGYRSTIRLWFSTGCGRTCCCTRAAACTTW